MSENDNNKELNNKNRFYYVLAFIPFANLANLFVVDIQEDELLKKFTTQWLSLLWIYFVLSIILSFFWLLWLLKYIFLAYFLLSIYLAWNAYNWHYINLTFLNKISSLFNWNKKDEE